MGVAAAAGARAHDWDFWVSWASRAGGSVPAVGWLSARDDEHGLLATGGSDYHGALKPTVFLGESVKGVKIPFKIAEPWLRYVKRYPLF